MEPEDRVQRRRASVVLTVVLSMVLLLWAVHLWGWLANDSFYWLGVYPRSVGGLVGILLAPFIHSSWGHLASNSVALVTVGALLLYFYPRGAWWAVLASWLGSGLVTWCIGRPAYHVGASGLIYGMAFFAVTRGFLLHRRALWAVSLLLIFLYGSLIWGLFPGQPDLSWEGHLGGAIAGILTAYALGRDGGANRGVMVWGQKPFRYTVHHTGGENLRARWVGGGKSSASRARRGG